MARAAKKESTKPGELREEVRLRREMARFQAEQVKSARKMLAVYGAANKGRGNRDWRASPASADASIIPDAAVLNARGRQCVRDSWIGRSAVRAFSRNVVGCGVLPIPMVRDKTGEFLPKVNKKILKLFWAWANNKNFCDVEMRQSFWQKQNLMVEERVTVGEGILVWSYRKPSDPATVGLRLQSFESEQFDLRLQSFTDPATGKTNQVRGGVEVDEWGAPVAYHFYTRNPADYLPVNYQSVRIPASRVFHYFKQERVLQVRGVTQLAPVLQDIRDFNRFREATLWRAIMEACIGMVIKKELPGVAGSNVLGMGNTTADPATTGDGKRLINFSPGMVVELGTNEEADFNSPTTPGNTFAPFSDYTLNGVGAGMGISGSQITRQSKSNYSAARQDMLEDRREFEPEQEMLAHNCVIPICQLFVRFAMLEGKLDDVIDAAEFAAEPERFLEAEYVAPAALWIDPEKEANAYEKLIELNVISREEIAALRGHRLDDIWDRISSEKKKAASLDIELTPEPPIAPPTKKEDSRNEEDDSNNAQLRMAWLYSDDQPRDEDGKFASDGGDSEGAKKESESPQTESKAFKDWFGDSKITDDSGDPMIVYHGTSGDFQEFDPKAQKSKDIKGFYFSVKPSLANVWASGDHGVIMPAFISMENPATMADVERIAKSGVKTKDLHKALKKEGFDGVFDKKLGVVIAFDPTQIKSAIGNKGTFDRKSKNTTLGKRLQVVRGTMETPPRYRSGDELMQCGTCSYLTGSMCSKFNYPVDLDKVCDAWEAKPVSRNDQTGKKLLASYTPDGEKPLDLQFQSDAATRDVGTIGPNP